MHEVVTPPLKPESLAPVPLPCPMQWVVKINSEQSFAVYNKKGQLVAGGEGQSMQVCVGGQLCVREDGLVPGRRGTKRVIHVHDYAGGEPHVCGCGRFEVWGRGQEAGGLRVQGRGLGNRVYRAPQGK